MGRTCRKCGSVGPFYDGSQRWCIECHRDNARKSYHRRKSEDPHINRRSYLKLTFGLTLEQYDAMLSGQDGGCAICGGANPRRRLVVDHQHDTGVIRGLLCDECNLGLGKFRDDPSLLIRAASYLNGGI